MSLGSGICGTRPKLPKPLVLLCFWHTGSKKHWFLLRFCNSGRVPQVSGGPRQSEKANHGPKASWLAGCLVGCLTGWLAGWLAASLRHPAQVAQTISFTVVFAHKIKKALVLLCFFCFFWCGTRHRICFIKKALVFMPFYDRGSKKHWFYCVFLLLGCGCGKKPIKPVVLMHFLHMEFVSGIWNLRPPAKVAKTISIHVFLAHRIKKALVFIAFLQHWSAVAVAVAVAI